MPQSLLSLFTFALLASSSPLSPTNGTTPLPTISICPCPNFTGDCADLGPLAFGPGHFPASCIELAYTFASLRPDRKIVCFVFE